MSEFRTAIDIANRACQHCGQERIDETLGFNENSRQAREIAAVYDKLRRAELERNTWRFSIRKAVLRPRDADTMLLAPSAWVSSATYFAGCIVEHDGMLWISYVPSNLGVEPGTTSDWRLYFGPMTADAYDSSTTYAAGELAYTAGGAGTYRAYLSLQDSNADNPATATAWGATATYFKNQMVTYLTVPYMSLIDLNVNNIPSAAPALWSALTTYSAGAHVGASDGVIYSSVGSGNINHDPTTDGGVNWTNTGVLNPWTTVFVGGTGSLKWLQIGGVDFPNGVGLEVLNIPYPLGAGPSSQSSSRNVFHLPAGYVKIAPQDPKAGSLSVLGAPSGRDYEQWDFEDDFLVDVQTGPIIFRFAADAADVTRMNSMFCEMLALRLALAVCETLTQSTAKIGAIAQQYQKFGTEARSINAIETGAVEPPLDDYIACRA